MKISCACVVAVMIASAASMDAARAQAPSRGGTGPAHAGAAADTLRLNHPSMVFYTPTSAERDSLQSVSVFAFDSLAVRFEAVRDRLSPFLNKQGIDPITSSARCFTALPADTVVFVRAEYKDCFGIIYFKPGKEPLITKGVPTDSDMFKTMMKYFSIHR
jgi:hypothetical protein